MIYWCLWNNQVSKKLIREILIQFAGFAAMRSRAATCFVFPVELEELAVAKILPRRFEMCVECAWNFHLILRVIPFRRSYAGRLRHAATTSSSKQLNFGESPVQANISVNWS